MIFVSFLLLHFLRFSFGHRMQMEKLISDSFSFCMFVPRKVSMFVLFGFRNANRSSRLRSLPGTQPRERVGTRKLRSLPVDGREAVGSS